MIKIGQRVRDRVLNFYSAGHIWPARFLVHGVLRRSDDTVIVYGDIIEGSIRAGMRITVPSGAAGMLVEPIRAIDFLDAIASGVTCVGLTLKPPAPIALRG